MPVRFRRTVKILPRVKVNISKKGIRQTVGLPGSGLSATSYIMGGRDDGGKTGEHDDNRKGEGRGCGVPGCGCVLFVVIGAAVLGYFVAAKAGLHPELLMD